MNQELLDKYKLSPIRSIAWDEIYSKWKECEEEVWRSHYTERGHDSWDSWRRQYIEAIKPESRSWKLYKVTTPAESISKMYIGPFKGWTGYYDNREQSTFADIAKNLDPEKRKALLKIANNFPKEMFIWGLADSHRIMTMEGSHRSAAATLAYINQIPISSDVEIALSHYNADEQDSFDKLFTTIVKAQMGS